MAPSGWGGALYGDVAMPDFAARPCVWDPTTTRDDATWQRIAQPMDEVFQGAIVIANQGCACYGMLVTTGPARGRIMYVSLDGGVPMFCEDVDFVAWYERWLDELLAGFEHFWFGSYMPGDEPTFARLARSGAPERRRDAIEAMSQLRELTEETCAVVALAVRDPDAEVRAAALWLVDKHALVAALEPHVRAATADPSAKVRRAALRALVKSKLPWHDAARVALRDSDPELVAQALGELAKSGPLGEDELYELLGSPHDRVRMAARTASASIASARIFDRVLDELCVDGDGPNAPLLQALLAQVRLGIDAERRDVVLSIIRERLATAVPPDAQTTAVRGLVTIAQLDPAAREELFALTRHPIPFVRWDAANMLGEHWDRDALPSLRALTADTTMPRAPLHSTVWSVGEAARRAIARIEARG